MKNGLMMSYCLHVLILHARHRVFPTVNSDSLSNNTTQQSRCVIHRIQKHEAKILLIQIKIVGYIIHVQSVFELKLQVVVLVMALLLFL